MRRGYLYRSTGPRISDTCQLAHGRRRSCADRQSWRGAGVAVGFTLIAVALAARLAGDGRCGSWRRSGHWQAPACVLTDSERHLCADRNGSQGHRWNAVPRGASCRVTGVLDAHDWRIDPTPIGAPAKVGGSLWTPSVLRCWYELRPAGCAENRRRSVCKEARGQSEAGELRPLVRCWLLTHRGYGICAGVDRDHHRGAVNGGRAMAS